MGLAVKVGSGRSAGASGAVSLAGLVLAGGGLALRRPGGGVTLPVLCGAGLALADAGGAAGREETSVVLAVAEAGGAPELEGGAALVLAIGAALALAATARDVDAGLVVTGVRPRASARNVPAASSATTKAGTTIRASRTFCGATRVESSGPGLS